MNRLDQIRPERLQRITGVANNRQENLTIVLENVHDPHNIGAVLRSADAIGLKEVFILCTEEGLLERINGFGNRTTAGTKRWVKTNVHTDIKSCFSEIRKQYNRILTTHLYEDSTSIYDTNFTDSSTAIVFGNEHSGVSQEAIDLADGNIIIPQVGMVESLNISVACAVTLFEAFRQKQLEGHYTKEQNEPLHSKRHIFDDYIDIHLNSKRKN